MHSLVLFYTITKKINTKFGPEPRFWYIYFQTSRDQIPTAYESEKARLFSSLSLPL